MMINYSERGHTGLILLNRPEKRNSLHPDLIKELKDKLSELKDNSHIKTLIISGEGSSFCAGADLEYLNEMSSYSTAMNEKDSQSIAELFLQIYEFPKPVIAAVNGPAIAGGCGLATVCDFVIADENNARFGYTEVKIGFIPAIVSIFLIRRLGEGRARQHLLSGKIMEAEEAFQEGIADYLAQDALLEAFNLAEELNKNSSYSMKLTKELTQRVAVMSVRDAVDYCIKLNTISRSSEDFKNGISKFLTK